VPINKFTLMALTGFIEALRHAADVGDRSRQVQCSWAVIGEPGEAVESSCGIEIVPRRSFSDPLEYDYIAVVGGLLSAHQECPARLHFLQKADQLGISLIGLCTGSFVLARAGLMDGKRCCVSYYHVHEFQEEFANREIRTVADTLFILDGSRITCAGGLAAVDLAIYLIERHLGSHRAQKSVSQMIHNGVRSSSAPQPRPETAWYAGTQSDIVRQVILLMELHFSSPLAITALAQRVCLSVKQLERLFHAEFKISPCAFYRKLRLEAARFMLEETRRSITAIALDCGFGDTSHFSRAFRAAYGRSPRSSRDTKPL
jgi:transcriptional regulator GlxA family with amidase domain